VTAFDAFQSLNRTVYRTVLTNGITLLVTPNPAADIVSTRMFLRGGQRLEPSGKEGVAHLVASLLTKGTATRSSLEIASAIESIGASLGTDSASDHFQVTTKSISADFPTVFALAGEVMRSPQFPEDEIALERKLTLQGIRSQQEQPFSVAMGHLRQAFYGTHPYADSGLGTLETVANLQREDLIEYHTQVFRPDNLIISLAGRISPETAIDQVSQVFGDWSTPVTPWQIPVLPTIPYDPKRVLTPQATAQSIVMVGHLATSIHPEQASSTDYATLKLINTYLGSGLSSRLFVELREKRGLAYEVSAFYPMRLETSHFVAYMGTSPDNTQIAIDGLQTELDRLTHTPLSPEELQVAKDKLLGQYALSKQTNAQLAQTFGWYEMLGLGLSYDRRLQEDVRNVTVEAIQAVADRTFKQPYLSILGPEAVLETL
jgi:zinc protease